jgi:hypothetical protein
MHHHLLGWMSLLLPGCAAARTKPPDQRLSPPMRATKTRPLCCRAVIRFEAPRRDFPGRDARPPQLGRDLPGPRSRPEPCTSLRTRSWPPIPARWWRSGASTKPDARESPVHPAPDTSPRAGARVSSLRSAAHRRAVPWSREGALGTLGAGRLVHFLNHMVQAAANRHCRATGRSASAIIKRSPAPGCRPKQCVLPPSLRRQL